MEHLFKTLSQRSCLVVLKNFAWSLQVSPSQSQPYQNNVWPYYRIETKYILSLNYYIGVLMCIHFREYKKSHGLKLTVCLQEYCINFTYFRRNSRSGNNPKMYTKSKVYVYSIYHNIAQYCYHFYVLIHQFYYGQSTIIYSFQARQPDHVRI